MKQESLRIDDMCKILNEKGLRITNSRKEVLTFIVQSTLSHSVDDIFCALKKTVDRATVYRILYVLESLCLVTKAYIHGHAIFYRAANHHSLLICTACKKVEIVNSSPIKIDYSLRNSFGFSSISKSIIRFHGICKKCALRLSENLVLENTTSASSPKLTNNRLII